MPQTNLLNQLENELDAIHKTEVLKRQLNWSASYLQHLIESGINNGYTVYSKQIPNKYYWQGWEWPFDVCWVDEQLDENAALQTFGGIHLICEMVYSTSRENIINTFCIMNNVQANTRILIVPFNTEEEFYEMVCWCEHIAEKMKLSNSSFLIFGSGPDETPLCHYLFQDEIVSTKN